MVLKFGTSGLRGLVSEMNDLECYLYTTAFLKYLKEKLYISESTNVSISGDFRKSTPRIINACASAIIDSNYNVDYCGLIPTPAISLHAFSKTQASIMVTGSHIPEDRNGIKFNLPTSEILKEDEIQISKKYKEICESDDFKKISQKFNENKMLKQEPIHLLINPQAREFYIKRFIDFLPSQCLKNKKIVFYQHSTVQRDILPEILKQLGAEVICVSYTVDFASVDSEAVRDTDLNLAKKWAQEYRPDAILSADGDGDRALLFDEKGDIIRGDILGVLTSIYLNVDFVSAPISANTSLEKSGKIKNILRTKIGSPFVISAMNEALKNGEKRVGSYEANGGYLTGSNINLNGKNLIALPTRDATLPLICSVLLSKDENLTLSEINKKYSIRVTHSDIIDDINKEKSNPLIQKFISQRDYSESFFNIGKINSVDTTDGVRMIFENEEIIHIRPSGNAPQLRCYTESSTTERAKEINLITIEKLKKELT